MTPEASHWVVVLREATKAEPLYQLKPVLELTSHVLKKLINVIYGNLQILAPVYGSFEWDSENRPQQLKEAATEMKSLHRDDEYAGRLVAGQCIGDSIFTEASDSGAILATCIAGLPPMPPMRV